MSKTAKLFGLFPLLHEYPKPLQRLWMLQHLEPILMQLPAPSLFTLVAAAAHVAAASFHDTCLACVQSLRRIIWVKPSRLPSIFLLPCVFLCLKSFSKFGLAIFHGGKALT